MDAHDIRRLFPNASASCIAANAGGAQLPERGARQGDAENDAVRPELEPSDEHGTLGHRQAKSPDTRRFFIRITSIRRILLDEDNLCEKYLVDCCRYAGLLPGDRPGQTKIEVRQRKAEKGEQERSVIEIFTFPETEPSLDFGQPG